MKEWQRQWGKRSLQILYKIGFPTTFSKLTRFLGGEIAKIYQESAMRVVMQLEIEVLYGKNFETHGINWSLCYGFHR